MRCCTPRIFCPATPFIKLLHNPHWYRLKRKASVRPDEEDAPTGPVEDGLPLNSESFFDGAGKGEMARLLDPRTVLGANRRFSEP
jgi:hypothetical protein